MKLGLLDRIGAIEPTLIATFGQARIVRRLDGSCELRGGTPDDQAAARKWASMFMHGCLHHPGGMLRRQPPAARQR